MRLPGTFHIDGDGNPGGLTSIIHTSDKYYTVRDIEKGLPSRKIHEKMIEAGRYSDYKSRTLDEVREALDKVPPRKAGTGTYHIYRNLFWGLIKAVRGSRLNSRSGHQPDAGKLPFLERTSSDRNLWWERRSPLEPFGTGQSTSAGGHQLHRQSQNSTSPLSQRPSMLEIRANWRKAAKDRGRSTAPAAWKASKKEYRYNIFTQQIEQEEKVLEGIERFYLKLAQMRLKISKEVAIDCVVEVAKENSYDPVRAYLEHCSQCSRAHLHRQTRQHLPQTTRRQQNRANPLRQDAQMHLDRCCRKSF